MINNENDNSTVTVTNDLKTKLSNENNQTMPSTVSVNDSTGEEQSVHHINNGVNENGQNNGIKENDQNNESQDKQLVPTNEEQQQIEGNNDDEFIRITAAHQMLTEAQTYDEQKNYPAALHLYRICVDLLLEELMFTEGTERSRVYLREKCTAIMDRIDTLKTMLDPIPSSTSSPLPLPTTTEDEQPSTTNEQQEIKAPTDELNSLNIS